MQEFASDNDSGAASTNKPPTMQQALRSIRNTLGIVCGIIAHFALSFIPIGWTESTRTELYMVKSREDMKRELLLLQQSTFVASYGHIRLSCNSFHWSLLVSLMLLSCRVTALGVKHKVSQSQLCGQWSKWAELDACSIDVFDQFESQVGACLREYACVNRSKVLLCFPDFSALNLFSLYVVHRFLPHP